mgnify:CR=1 FL=1
MTHEHGPGHAAAPTATAADWDARYAASELIWGAGPNRFVAQHTADLPPGRAVDIACGEGRNAVYLAERGWHVTGVDFSAKALEKARQLEAAMAQQHSVIPVTWICADALIFTPDPVDLAMIVYAHLPAAVRRTVLKRAAAALRPGGRLIYATCSVLPGENEDRVAEFLARNPQFRVLPAGPVWQAAVPGRAWPVAGDKFRASPYATGTDGFFACVMTNAGGPGA